MATTKDDPTGPRVTHQQDNQGKPDPRLPHERDQSHDDVGHEPREVMKQAQKDIESGQVDTDLHGMRGVEEAHRDKGPRDKAQR
ncbi:hypothetical protein FXN63_05315 [Pigmentiphaga aceris]|uniref:Uncharacterized protein n=1 Tax=Pigmentiphaga aceris TaxID=1940612 RepID=A0A5C0AUH3_9BURK|nr:hypothetical protein [Pigmentiphaga aceris]QEI05324.1 hypothetical protein FXN63_05315 [Pigmentiphaga aceris]